YSYTVNSLSVEKRKIKEDFKEMLTHLEKRYGSFDLSKANNILSVKADSNTFYMGEIGEMAANFNPKSDDVGLVMLILESPFKDSFLTGSKKNVKLSLIYMDKDLAKIVKDKKANRASG